MGRWAKWAALGLVAMVAWAAVSPSFALSFDPFRGPDARPLPKRSRSVGLPWDGKLKRGLAVVPSRFLRLVTEYAPAGHHFGTWELVQLLERAAFRVHQRHPGAKLSVGELSADGGGNIAGHASHESGRDADLGFYMLDGAGRPYDAFAFADFDAQGRGTGPNEGLRFDDARNWALIEKLVADGDARVQFIFVANHLRDRLLAQARAVGAPKAVQQRAAQVLMRPPGNHAHANHFHLRIYCAPADRPQCKDQGPIWPWYPGVHHALTKAMGAPPNALGLLAAVSPGR